jgi:hypothetical protein
MRDTGTDRAGDRPMEISSAGNRTSIGILSREDGAAGANYRIKALIWSAVAVGISGAITFVAAGAKNIRVSASSVIVTISHSGSVGMVHVGVIAALSALPLLMYFEMLVVLAGKALRGKPVSVGEAWLVAIRRTPAALGPALIPVGLIFLFWVSWGLSIGSGLSAAWMVFLAVASWLLLLVVTAWLAFIAAGTLISVLAYDASSLTAMRNSWRSSYGRFWYATGRILYLSFLEGIICVLVGAPFLIAGKFIAGESGHISALSISLVVIGQGVSGAYGLTSVALDVIRLYSRLNIHCELNSENEEVPPSQGTS